MSSEQEKYESVICQDVSSEENIIATYFLSASENKYNLFDLAWNLAVGQSIGNPNTRSLFETDEMILAHSCKILGKKEDLVKKREGIVKIAFPLVNINLENDGISQMLCHFMGGQLDINMFQKCVLKDFQLPEKSKKHFLGPKFGIKGFRDFVNNHDRPLLGAIIKPKVGATKEILLEMTKQLVEGGVEFIKEDEIMSNPDVAPLEERVPYIMNYLNSIERKVVYCFSITSDFPHCLERVKLVHKLGGNGVHINFWSGLGVYNAIRKLDLPIFLHFQKSGDKILTNKRHDFHIEWPVICKIARMSGADFIHAGMWGGYYHEEEEDLRRTFAALKDGDDYEGTVPALSGGMHPGLVGAVKNQFGNDVMCSCGGSIHGHPSGTLAGTKAMQQAIEAATKEIDLDTVNLESELKEAIDKWGYIKSDIPKEQKFNIIVPMAGRGQRWIDAGYTFPKPLIEIENKPMIELVLKNINLEGNYIFICLKEHIEKFSLDTVLKNLKPDCKIISIDEITDGAASTILKAKDMISKDDPIIVANCDQLIDWSSSRFIDFINKKNPDGALVTYTSTHPRNSFVKTNEENQVIEIAEKKPISDIANAGIFYSKSGKDMILAIENMINKNIRTNNEFFLSTAFNEYDLKKSKILTYHVKEVKSMGTPEELENSRKTNWNKTSNEKI